LSVYGEGPSPPRHRALLKLTSGYAGFILSVSGQSIYHAGDTDFIPEMKNLKVDSALLPVSGTFVMTAEEAASAVKSPDSRSHARGGSGRNTSADYFKEKVKVPVLVLSKEK
jgi:hypothetical protein